MGRLYIKCNFIKEQTEALKALCVQAEQLPTVISRAPEATSPWKLLSLAFSPSAGARTAWLLCDQTGLITIH